MPLYTHPASEVMAALDGSGNPRSPSIDEMRAWMEETEDFVANLEGVGFIANKNGVDQSGIASGSTVKVTFTNEMLDEGGYYDAANSKFTPPAGRYVIGIGIYASGLVDANSFNVYLYKNGAPYRFTQSVVRGAVGAEAPSWLVDANGTDYFEAYFYADGSGNKTVGGNVVGSVFWGCKVDGVKGDQGAAGADGNDPGVPFNFAVSTTMGDPSAGNVRLNNAAFLSTTAIAISVNSADTGNPSVAAWLKAFDDSTTVAHRGIMILRKASAPQNFAIFDINGALTDNTTWLQLSVAYIAGNGSFSASDRLSVQFARTGDLGGTGASGVSGTSALTRVRVAATSNVTIASALENGDTIDGVTLATNDLVLLTAQTAPAENGVYVVQASGAAVRHTDFDTYDELPGTYFSVMEGTSKADTLWRCTSNRGGTIGTTAVPVSEFISSGSGSSAPATSVDVVKRNYVTSKPWLLGKSAADNGWTWVEWSPELALFCAVGESGTGNRVMTSPDGINWTSRTSSADVNWHGVAWSSDLRLFVAVATSVGGGTVRVMTSPDGITWTSQTTPSTNSYNIVKWVSELGLFVAIGADVITSPDGITWTAHTAPVTTAAIDWSPELGLFVAVGSNAVMTSPDGINWTSRTPAEANNWHGVAWSSFAQLFAAVSLDGTHRVMTSPDGITWTARTEAVANQWRGICYSPDLGLFCAVAGTSTGDAVMTSPDGITWTSGVTPADNSWLSVVWSPQLGIFCSTSYSGTGTRAMTSASSKGAGSIGNYIYVDNGGGASPTVTISNASPGVVTGAHGINVAPGINACVACYLTTTGSLPTGLLAGTIYYAVVVDSTHIKLATSVDNALAGTFINTSSAGSGTHTLHTNAIPLVNNTTINLAGIQMPAGDFDASAAAVFAGGATTTVNGVVVSIGTTSAGLNQVFGYYGKLPSLGTPFSGGGDLLINTGVGQISKTAPTTYYLVGFMGFGTSTAQVNSVGISAGRSR